MATDLVVRHLDGVDNLLSHRRQDDCLAGPMTRAPKPEQAAQQKMMKEVIYSFSQKYCKPSPPETRVNTLSILSNSPMPGMDGINPMRYLCAREKTPFQPIASDNTLEFPLQTSHGKQGSIEDGLLGSIERCSKRLKECDGSSRLDISCPDPDSDPQRKNRRGVQTGTRFACPFMKMFPWAFVNRKSCLSGWASTHRLK
jgi:hypothetical protein